MYACGAGMLNSTSVPVSSPLQTVSFPPASFARSRIPRNPRCPSRPCARTPPRRSPCRRHAPASETAARRSVAPLQSVSQRQVNALRSASPAMRKLHRARLDEAAAAYLALDTRNNLSGVLVRQFVAKRTNRLGQVVHLGRRAASPWTASRPSRDRLRPPGRSRSQGSAFDSAGRSGEG